MTTLRVGAAVAVAMALQVLSAAAAYAATPTPAPGGDPRSSGEGPGLVGDPAFAIIAVVAIGVATLVVTLVYIRATGGRRA